MIKYEDVRPYWVLQEIRDGKKVYVCDRKFRSVHSVNTSPIEDVLKAIDSKEDERYAFWSEEEVADEVEEETESDDGKL